MASFSAYWAGRTEVAWPNVAYVPSSDSARESGFVRLVITGTGGEQVDLGRRRFRRFGLIGIMCCIAEGAGTERLDAIARAAVLFLRESLPLPGGVMLFDQRLVDVGVVDGWAQINAIANFRYDTEADGVPLSSA